MRNFFINLIKFVIGILILRYTDRYFTLIITNMFGKMPFSNIIHEFLVYLIITVCIFLIYRNELVAAYNGYKSKFASNFLYTVISFIIIFIVIAIVQYVCLYIARTLDIGFKTLSFYSPINRVITLDVILRTLMECFFYPFFITSLFILGVNNALDGKTGYVISGMLYSFIIVMHLHFNASLLLSCVPYIILFALLSFVYRKNSNIVYSIITFSLYTLFAGILTARFLMVSV